MKTKIKRKMYVLIYIERKRQTDTHTTLFQFEEIIRKNVKYIYIALL